MIRLTQNNILLKKNYFKVGNRIKWNAVKIDCRESLLLFLTYAPSTLTSLRYTTQAGTAGCTCLTSVAKYKRTSQWRYCRHKTRYVDSLKVQRAILHIAAKWLQVDTCVTVADCDIGPRQVEQDTAVVAEFERQRLRHRLAIHRLAKGLTLRLLMSYIYILSTYSWCF